MEITDIERFIVGLKSHIPEVQAVEDAQLLSSLSDTLTREVDTLTCEVVSSTTELKPSERQINVFLPACQVCGGISTGMHFGAATCEPCKTFFRRSLGKEDKILSCKLTPPGFCADRNDGSKISCTACRYRKCVAVGMHKDGAKKGRYSYAMKTRQTKFYRTSQAMEIENHVLNDQALEDRLQLVATAFRNVFVDTAYALINKDDFNGRTEELIGANIDRLKTDHVYSPGRMGQFPLLKERFNMMDDVFMVLKDVPGVFLENKDGFMPLQNPTILQAMKTLWACWAHEIEASFLSLTRFAKQIPGFSELPIEDRMVLMKDVRSESLISLKQVAINTEHEVYVKYSSVSDEMILLPCAVMKTKLAGEESYEDHVKLTKKMKTLNLTIEDLAVLNVLLILAPDRDGLVAGQLIDQLQEEWVPVLQHSIRKNHPNRQRVLADILLLLPEFRQSTQNQKKFFMRAGKLVDPVMSPLLHEVLFSSPSQT